MHPEIVRQREQIEEAAAAIRRHIPRSPEAGIICGTGMGDLGDRPEGLIKIPYGEIPHFPLPTVESHHGYLCLGQLGGRQVMVFQGRFHRYEGYSLKQVTFPVRVLQALGVKALFIMNAVGSVNPLIPAGSLVLLTDHINMMGDNPLIGPNDDALGPRFPDMSEPYSRKLLSLAEDVALKNGIRTHRGVAVAVTGPNLETAAEYRMFQRIGVDVVTMSTIPEVIAGVHAGMSILALSTVTDACLPDALKPAHIEDIIRVANSLEPARQRLLLGVLERLGEAVPSMKGGT